MTGQPTLLVGGLSSVHDPLLAAALRGCGKSVELLHPRTDAGLRRARALGNHGQCNPAHYAVGAVLEHTRCSGLESRAFCADRVWLTLGSCGPCRLAAFPHEYARVLRGAGLGRLPVVFVDQLRFVEACSSSGSGIVGAKEASALVAAVVAGDVVTQVASGLRPYAVAQDAVESLITATVAALGDALERRASPVSALRDLRANAASLAIDRMRVLPRVLLVGEPWTTLADGDPSYDLVRRLGVLGAEVAAPTATEWLRFRLWEEAELRPQERRALANADTMVRETWTWFAGSAGIRTRPLDLERLAQLARPYYDPRVRGGSAHLEIGRALEAVAARSTHLVLSLKPFGCLPSSSLSDGILSLLLRAERAPTFLALETTGDADATAESRVDMALHAATLRAIEEFERACDGAGLLPTDGLELLKVDGEDGAPETAEPRMYACAAAERVRAWATACGSRGRTNGVVHDQRHE